MSGLYVVGLDLSLTAPGVAGTRGVDVAVSTIRIPAKMRDIARIDHIVEQTLLWTAGADLVLMEGFAPGAQRAGIQSGVDERAGLRWIIKREIIHAGLPFAEISPSKLKKFGTGKGNASKHEMTVCAVRRFPDVEFGDDNQVDACWLAAAGSQWLGQPVVPLPKAQVEVLSDGVIWPDLPALPPERGQVLAEVTELLGRHDGSRAASVSMLSGLSRAELDVVGGVPESVA